MDSVFAHEKLEVYEQSLQFVVGLIKSNDPGRVFGEGPSVKEDEAEYSVPDQKD